MRQLHFYPDVQKFICKYYYRHMTYMEMPINQGGIDSTIQSHTFAYRKLTYTDI